MGQFRTAGLALMAGCALAPPPLLGAQQESGAQQPSRYFLEIQTSQRWMHGGQQPQFTPHHPDTDWLAVDSIRATAEHFTLFVSGPKGVPPGRGWIRTGADGLVETQYVFDPVDRPSGWNAMDEWEERNRYFVHWWHDYLRLPEFHLHQLAPPVVPPGSTAGQRWSDTISFSARRGGQEQELSGRRFSWITGDTTVAGRRLLVVHDSARVRYRERWLRRERTLDTLVVTERGTHGHVTGRFLYDPAIGIYRVREDSLWLTGNAVLRYPDGRSFRTSARYDRIRRIDVYDNAEYRARREALRAESEAAHGGMITYPSAPLADRLAAADTVVRDSLLQVLRTTDDPNERQSVRMAIGWWPDPDAIRDLLQLAAEASADTAYLIEQLQESFSQGAGRQFDEAALRRALPFMADPGLAFHNNTPLDPFYENPRQELLLHAPAVSDDTSDWACTPAACRLLAEQIHAEGDPRLRALGLIAAFLLDPARYANEVIERAEAGGSLLRPTAELARGSPADGASNRKRVPLPNGSAHWRDWLHWINPPSTYESRFTLVPFGAPDLPAPPYFDERHLTALRVRERIDGRDIAQELANARSRVSADSALLVYDVLLLGMGELQPQPESVARLLQSDSEVARMRGRLALQYLFRDPQPVADDTAAELIGQLLASYLDGAEWWPRLPDLERATRARRAQASQRADSTVFLLRDGLPSAVIEVWRDRVQIVSVEDWNARPLRAAATLVTIGQLQRVGPFIRLSLTQETRHARGPHEAAGGWASGDEYTLMQT
ncbi:MAG TPA: hypothetical protein VFU06_11210, partial [Longimicrobiales bacterium]|nr:hypothetical protein [Longimicrobiales bacterium]